MDKNLYTPSEEYQNALNKSYQPEKKSKKRQYVRIYKPFAYVLAASIFLGGAAGEVALTNAIDKVQFNSAMKDAEKAYVQMYNEDHKYAPIEDINIVGENTHQTSDYTNDEYYYDFNQMAWDFLNKYQDDKFLSNFYLVMNDFHGRAFDPSYENPDDTNITVLFKKIKEIINTNQEVKNSHPIMANSIMHYDSFGDMLIDFAKKLGKKDPSLKEAYEFCENLVKMEINQVHLNDINQGRKL